MKIHQLGRTTAAGAIALVLLAACTDYAVPPKANPSPSLSSQTTASTPPDAGPATTSSSAPTASTSRPATSTRPSAVHIDFARGPSIIAALNRGGFRCSGTTRNAKVIVAKTDYRCTHSTTNDTSVTTYASATALKSALTGFGALLDKDRAVCGATWCVIVAKESDAPKVSAILRP